MSSVENENQLPRSAPRNVHKDSQSPRKAEGAVSVARAAQRESDEYLNTILGSITDGFAVFDRDWRILYLNPRAEEFIRPLRESVDQVLGKILWEEFPDLCGTLVEDNYRRAARECTTVEFEFYYPGLASWFLIRVFPSEEGVTVYFQDIGPRKRAEEALRAKEEFIRATFNQASVGIAVASLEGHFEEINDRFCSLLGYRADELQRLTFIDLTHPDDVAATRDNVARLLAGECEEYSQEKRYLRRDGAVIWSLTSVTLLKNEDGRPKRFIGVVEDITRRKQSEHERRRLTEVLDKSLNEIYIFDAETLRFQYVNQGALRNLGYDAGTLRDMTPLDLKPEYSPAEFRDLIQPLHDGIEDKLVFETLHRRADGSDYPVEVHLQKVDDAGRPLFVAVIIDITVRKRAEAALRGSEAQLRGLADSIPQLAWMAEPDGYIFWYNRRWYEYTGTSFEQMQGWGWQTVHDPEVLPQVLERWNRSIRHAEPFDMEFPIRGADGEFRWFLTRVEPLCDSEGRVLRWFGTNTDVDEVRRIHETLQEETRVLELLNQTGKMLSSNLDLQTLVQSVTDAATELSGAQFGAFFYNITNPEGESFRLYTLSGAPREAFGKFGLPRNTPVFNPTFRGEGVVRSGDITKDPRYGTMEPHRGMPAGHLPVRSYLAVPVIARGGEVIGGLFFGHPEPDMFSERQERLVVGLASQAAIAIDNAQLYEASVKAAEERKLLLESERAARAEAERSSEMKDLFLANLSHELRTPLSAILGWTQVLRLRTTEDEDLQQALETIERNARVQTQLIEDLLDMSRITSGKVRLDIQPVEPLTFIEAAIETVRPAADAKNIRLQKLLDPTAGPVSGDPGRLQQVIWNLLSNAIKFTPKGGKVQVLLERVNSHIEISVADTGIGIRPEYLNHIFERFRQMDASTTRKYGGLGLGLSIVKHLVELHGGSVFATSPGEGQGTTFSVHLPVTVVHRSSEIAERLHPKALMPLPADLKPSDLNDVRVLVVDDEPDARALIQRVLGDCGADVMATGDPNEAMAIIEMERPHVLISDIGMPEMDGFELLKRIRSLGAARGGRVPAVALTAFARSEDRTRALRAGFLIHLSKPVEPSELVATVASVTGRTGDP